MGSFVDMVGGLSGKDSISRGDISSAGGSTPEAQAFAQKICTKLGACQMAEISSPSTGRTR